MRQINVTSTNYWQQTLLLVTANLRLSLCCLLRGNESMSKQINKPENHKNHPLIMRLKIWV